MELKMRKFNFSRVFIERPRLAGVISILLTFEKLFLSDYANKQIKPALERIPGISKVSIYASKYSMRVWMDADRLAFLGLSADDVVRAVRGQNIQASIGSVGSAPGDGTEQMTYTLKSTGRLNDAEAFRDIVIRTGEDGAVVRLGDIARVEKDADSYMYSSKFNDSSSVLMRLNTAPEIMYAFSPYSASTPYLYLDIDRTKASLMAVEVSDIFDTLQTYFGSRYVNDVNFDGQTNHVTLQADWPFRKSRASIERIHVKSRTGAMVPLGSLVKIRTTLAPRALERYNKFTSATISAMTVPAISSGDAMNAVTAIAKEALPGEYGFDWSGLS